MEAEESACHTCSHQIKMFSVLFKYCSIQYISILYLLKLIEQGLRIEDLVLLD
jgi:hypothetical protein